MTTNNDTLVDAARSALFLIRNDPTNIGKVTAAELRTALADATGARPTATLSPRTALALCLAEIEQFHSTAYPHCLGGCPADEAMEAARNALA